MVSSVSRFMARTELIVVVARRRQFTQMKTATGRASPWLVACPLSTVAGI